ncbi:HNH endonuclease signature motif containing protein [Arthrobacter sp. H5]|uniref:HNH endonuclease n=1 Tax=Arthrobacter sp. H5 TaxID=1267973 RepID=UPI0020A64365|nr:HNH endonuclease signature motif containing protein [Arthrobacter sp. H5]
MSFEGCAPGELEGYGPIDPEIAAMLAGHAASFTRILTHPESGVVLSVGRDSYRPPAGLRKWVVTRDRACRHPGCNRPASKAEIDHTIPWASGGKTTHGNLSAFCKRHHMFKTEGFWHYRQPEPGLILAASLAGKTYTTLPEPPF